MATTNGLFEADLKLFRDAPHADCEIKCSDSGISFPAHKSVVCSRNAYFAAALGGKFQEASTSSITLDDAPFAVEALLMYLYTLAWPIRELVGNADHSITDWHFVFKIFEIADKRVADGLMLKAKDTLIELVEDQWDEDAVIGMLPAIWNLTGTNADHVRDAILAQAVEHHDSFVERAFNNAVLKSPEFGRDFCLKLSKKATATLVEGLESVDEHLNIHRDQRNAIDELKADLREREDVLQEQCYNIADLRRRINEQVANIEELKSLLSKRPPKNYMCVVA